MSRIARPELLILVLSAAAASGCAQKNPEVVTRIEAIIDAGAVGSDAAPDPLQPCPDVDGDGTTTCGGDCDDQSPFTRPGAREDCDEKDNDCDGNVDESFPELVNVSCTSGVGACAVVGRMVCAPDALGTRCETQPVAGGDERCNETDDDCDGAVDESLVGCCQAGTERPCGIDTGACEAGEQTCAVDGTWGLCQGGDGPADTESCDGLDNDCDGRTDEEIEGVGSVCNTGDEGACATGRRQCRPGSPECAPDVSPRSETCNDRDDDCDGLVDEGLINACGDCGPPRAEACNGVDEDCDLIIDEDAGRIDAPCVLAVGTVFGATVNGRLGTRVLVVQDVDGDGRSDVLASAPGPLSPPGPALEPETFVSGTLHVFSGHDLSALPGFGGAITDGQMGAALAAADFDGDGRDEWIVGTPAAQPDGNRNRTGRVDVLRAGTFELLARKYGDQVGSRFGHAVAAASIDGMERPIVVVGAPARDGNHGRAAVYDVEIAGVWVLDLRWDQLGALPNERLGEVVEFGPQDASGLRPVVYSRLDGANDDSFLAVRDEAGQELYEFVLPGGAGQALSAVAASRSEPYLVLGASGVPGGDDETGHAWVVEADVGEDEVGIVDEVAGGPVPDHLGFAVAIGDPLRANDASVWCVGAVTDAFAGGNRPGRVECRTTNGAARLRLMGRAGGDGFGWSISLGPIDADGTRLIAVGAPRDGAGAVDGGAVHLFRVSTE